MFLCLLNLTIYGIILKSYQVADPPSKVIILPTLSIL